MQVEARAAEVRAVRVEARAKEMAEEVRVATS
jgi:hypothetical protein